MSFHQVQHLFFDLDHTLWDFERNSTETMRELLVQYHGHMNQPVDHDVFIELYHQHNARLWKRYQEDKMEFEVLRRLRWHITFRELKIEVGDWVDQMGEEYLEQGPRKPHLIPNTIEVLDALKDRFALHIISNGHTPVQLIKMRSSGLDRYFAHMTCPDEAGVKKPDPRIFYHAMNAVGADPANSLYIGDNYEADVLGALRANMPVVYFNPDGGDNPDGVPEMKDLRELLAMLVRE
jgi:putative hydrolase of the HAD superfamily